MLLHLHNKGSMSGFNLSFVEFTWAAKPDFAEMKELGDFFPWIE